MTPLEKALVGKLRDYRVTYFVASELLIFGASHHDPESSAFGLNKLPDISLVGNIAAVAVEADKVRKVSCMGLKVLSCYRHPDYNAQLKGAARGSYHLRGMAIDLAPIMGDVSVLHRAARRHHEAGGLVGGLGFYDWGVHVDTGPKRSWGSPRG